MIEDFIFLSIGIIIGAAGAMGWMDRRLKKILTEIDEPVENKSCSLLTDCPSKKLPAPLEPR